MKILAFDTSNNATSVAISEGQNILAYIEDLNPSKQAEQLIPVIEQALHLAALTYNEIDYLGVIKGPGSFTGIRIGLATAKGIVLGANIKKGRAITNFEIAYYQACQQIKQYDKVIIFLNAYRNQLYTQVFDQNKNSSEPELINLVSVTDLVKQLNGTIICVGSGLEFIYNQIQSQPNIIILPRFSRIKALHICRYIDSTIKTSNLQNLEPLYIRHPSIKIKYDNEKESYNR